MVNNSSGQHSQDARCKANTAQAALSKWKAPARGFRMRMLQETGLLFPMVVVSRASIAWAGVVFALRPAHVRLNIRA